MTPKVGSFLLAILLLAHSANAQDIVAHRGASHTAPENTLAAFHLAWKQGADAIEGDFRLTKDGHIVCVHDEDFKRTANLDKRVQTLTLAEVQKLDVGSWKDPKFKGEPVPTLDQVLAIVPSGKRLFLEIKCGPEIIPALKKSVLKPEQVVFISFGKDVITQCRQHFPDFKAHWLTSYKENVLGRLKPSTKEVFKTLAETQASGLDTNANTERVTAAFVKQLRQGGYEFHCWTVNDLPLAKHFRQLKVDSITTDRPGWLRTQLGE